MFGLLQISSLHNFYVLYTHVTWPKPWKTDLSYFCPPAK